MPKGQLVRTLRRHHGYAAGSLEDQSRFLREGRDPEMTAEEWAGVPSRAGRIADEDLDVMAVCEAVLSAMGTKPPRRRRAA